MSKARDLADGTFDTDTLVVDAANNRVGIGTTSPSAALHVYNSGGGIVGLVEAASGYNARMRIQSGNANESFLEFADPDDSDVGEIVYEHSNNAMRFNTNASERMRIDSSGAVLIGIDSAAGLGTKDGLYFGPSGASIYTRSTTSSVNFFEFFNPNGKVGSIVMNSSSTSYNTSSDYRLKENVVDLTGASNRINQIPVHRFNFISDPDTTVDGFLAHEVQDIVPEAISGEKDAMRDEEYEVTPAVLDDDGNVVTEAVMGTRSVPDYQGIDQSKLVPLLTAALQEALSEIADLKTRVAALETS